MDVTTLPLAGWNEFRARCLVVGALFAGMFGFGVVGVWFVGSMFSALLGTGTSAGDLVLVVLLLSPVLAAAAAFASPAFTERAALEVHHDVLVLRHPGLGAPLVVRKEEVAAFTVDQVPPRHALPTLTLRILDRPNLAVRFRTPQPTTPPPVWVRIGVDRLFVGGRSVDGFLVTLDDAATAASSLGRWGTPSRLDPEHLVTPTEPIGAVRVAFVVVALAVLFALRWPW